MNYKKLLFIFFTLLAAAIAFYALYLRFIIKERFTKPGDLLTFIHTVDSPENNCSFALFGDYSDTKRLVWYIFRFNTSAASVPTEMPAGFLEAKDRKHMQFKDNLLTWNVSSANFDVYNPNIKVIEEKYLVFDRGGIHHFLYDIKNSQKLFEDNNPWLTFIYSEEGKFIDSPTDKNEMGALFNRWKVENIHNKIEMFIKQSDGAQ
ncbi:MAG: hypothetical protein JW728_03640 [Candidatus Aureabacteria bacterium]|nr:hypothetical protein [Candidatus Auribacterota bacterium]